MKLLFTSLLCHRDVEIFKFNWFAMRIFLDHGLDIPHLILHDGSLTDTDFESLDELTNVIIEKEPIKRYKLYKDIYWGKLECLERAFEKHGADRAILFDCDIFFLRNWDADLRKMISERAVVLRDWGSSIGPEPEKFYAVYGCREDVTTPNCNTGVISILKEDYPSVKEKFTRYINHPMTTETGPIFAEDQCAIFTAFYGKLSYVNGIKCLINNIESQPKLWDWVLKQNAAHLMGMRVRPYALRSLIECSLRSMPAFMHLSQISPRYKHISWGLLEYDHYNFSSPLHKIPSTINGSYISDAMYLHGGSHVVWDLPRRFNFFNTKIACLDTGIKENVKDIVINNEKYQLGSDVNLPLSGKLEIRTKDGPGTHIAFLEPRLSIDKSWPDLSQQKE